MFLNRGFLLLSLLLGAPVPASWIRKRGLLLELFVFTPEHSSMLHTAFESRMKDMGGIKTQETHLGITHSFSDDFLPPSSCHHPLFRLLREAPSPIHCVQAFSFIPQERQVEEASSICLNSPICQTRWLMADDGGLSVT